MTYCVIRWNRLGDVMYLAEYGTHERWTPCMAGAVRFRHTVTALFVGELVAVPSVDADLIVVQYEDTANVANSGSSPP
jgi:hypothetical protein